jgi:hypothetical protein
MLISDNGKMLSPGEPVLVRSLGRTRNLTGHFPRCPDGPAPAGRRPHADEKCPRLGVRGQSRFRVLASVGVLARMMVRTGPRTAGRLPKEQKKTPGPSAAGMGLWERGRRRRAIPSLRSPGAHWDGRTPGLPSCGGI